ncbi:YceI family protein [Mucilaginibacter sp. SMC90]|uniref:YceI family protein n=1 Tax=Mucilaginibacter sp. SMC90 TaxID=2929803 RepID=UPI001FB507F0|nr:YceI family protein [Mucilaginibacter sp. SMC90]UOE49784.1 YceI family protein [Mucilaginibacter sp. SMC90]
MKKTNKRISIIPLMIALTIFLAVPRLVKAQANYKLAPGSTLKVLGSSNVHDWTMTSGAAESQAQFDLANHSLPALTLRVPATSLKSEHSSMDDRTYTAINAKKYPDISFKLTSATVLAGDGNTYQIKANGDLTIAGVTKPITVEVTAVNADNAITCSGSKKIQLTDYGIKPPTFMLGAMKVYNDLTIQFNLIYKK